MALRFLDLVLEHGQPLAEDFPAELSRKGLSRKSASASMAA
jgi:hypothetical protein